MSERGSRNVEDIPPADQPEEPEKPKEGETRESSEALRAYIEKLRSIREELRDAALEDAQVKSEMVRERISREGLNFNTLSGMVDALQETNFEAFGLQEITDILAVIDYMILEWDPAYRQVLQGIKQKLQGAADMKRSRQEK